jgi:NAD-dependent deacetylase
MFTPPAGLVADLQHAQHVAVLTGAGISAESGIPTFRDAQSGTWARFNPEDLATRAGFQRDPALVWQWYAERRARVREVEPNAGHRALAAIERRVPRFTLITQNIDGLHQRAGSASVIELHGSLSRVKCFDEDVVVERWDETGDVPPRCPRCGGMLRPDVVWFGELLPHLALEAAKDACQTCDLFFSIGTSGVVEPAASMPIWAMQAGATVAFLNLEVRPQESPRLYRMNGPAGVLLPALVAAAWPDAAR